MPMLNIRQQQLWSTEVRDVGETEAILRALDFFVPDIRVNDRGLFCPEGQSSTCANAQACKEGAPGRTLELVEYLLRLRDERTIKDLYKSVQSAAFDLGPDADPSRVIDAAYRDITRAQNAVLQRFGAVAGQSAWASVTMSVTVFATALTGLATGHAVAGLATAATVELLRALGSQVTGSAVRKRDLKTLVTQSIDHGQLAKHMAAAKQAPKKDL